MGFNELNSVENYIIKQLTGVNLNTYEASEDKALYNGFWQYKKGASLRETVIKFAESLITLYCY